MSGQRMRPETLADIRAWISRQWTLQPHLRTGLNYHDVNYLLAELDAVTRERDEARQTLAEWRTDLGPLARQSRQSRDTDPADPDAQYRAVGDDATIPLGFHDGERGGES